MSRARASLALLLATFLILVPTTGTAMPEPLGRAPAGDLGSDGITISRVSPLVAAPDEPITIAGVLDVAELGIELPPEPEPTTTAETESDDGATDDPPVASVEVRVGTAAIRRHDDVSAWISSSSPATGAVLTRTDLRSTGSPDTERIPFTVTIDDLGSAAPVPYGVVPISLEVHLPGQAGPSRALHTFIGSQTRKEYVPLTVSWIVPFTVPADPVLVGEFGAERTDAWERLVGSEGTLRQRLAAGGGDGVVWVIDPALLTAGPVPEPAPDEDPDPPAGTTGPAPGSSTSPAGTPVGSPAAPAPASSTGPVPGSSPGSSPAESEPTGTNTDEPAPPVTNAQRERDLRTGFARDLREEVAGRDVLLLPWHDADISALPAADDSSAAATALRDVLTPTLDITQIEESLTDAGARVRPTVWPADGTWTGAQDDALHHLSATLPDGRWSVLTRSDSTVAPLPGPTSTVDDTLVLPVDPVLSARVATAPLTRTAASGPTTLTTGLALMADTLITLNDRAGTARHVLITLDRDLTTPQILPSLAGVLTQVPWLTTGPLSVSKGTATWGSAPESSTPTTSALTPDRAVQLRHTLDQLPTAATVRIGTGTDLATRGADTLAQLTSQRWRAAPQDWSTAYTPVAEQVSQTFTSVRIPPRDIAFLADTGTMRVTVENTLDDGIRNAYLSLTVDQPILRIESEPQPVEIGADSRSTVAFDASAIASGQVRVTAVVRAVDGTHLSEPTTFTVRVSPTSDWIYWALGAVALVVIAAGLARMALRQRPQP